MFEQIIFDILLWLPLVSLLRLKMVCKSWFALIESSAFVNQHLHHHSGEDALIVSYSKSRKLEFCLFSGNKYEESTNIDFEDRFYKTVRADNCFVDLADSCDGIICLQDGSSGVVALWNPALKQLRSLPKSSIFLRAYNSYLASQFTVIGFGFDAKVNDYKVVRIIWRSTMPEVNQIEVYNLRTSFCWRIIHKNSVLPFTHLKAHYHATSKNGTRFWLGLNNHDGMLVSFDFKDEVFETMSLPDSQESKTFHYALDFLNDKLAYIRGLVPYPCYNYRFEIWVLHEFGMKESWNKLYNIGPTSHNIGLYPTGFSKNGEFLLLKDFRGKEYTRIPEHDLYYLRFVIHYNESLVSVKKVVNGGDQ